MRISVAVIVAAFVLVIGGGLAAYAVLPRYSLANPGGGISVRLDRRTGDMLGCAGLDCRPIVADGKPITVPAPPPGYKIDRPGHQ